jgi:staphylococcal nuclease domain-containing protein 1
VGKPCVFRVDYAIQAAGGREFGTVFINEKDNVALAAAAAGWARVRPAGGGQGSPFLEELVKAGEAAEARGAGVHTPDKAAAAAAVRPAAADFDAAALLQRLGRGRPVQAIVEGVNSGSSLRVTLLPDLTTINVMVAGVQCPSMGRRAPPPATPAPAPAPAAAAAAAPTAAAAAAALPEAQPEPFAREARHFAELRCLNRECRLVLDGVSQFGVLVATVLHPLPAPQAAAAAPQDAAAPALGDLGLSLAQAGLARVVDWSANLMSSGAFKLREAERAARQARTGLWHSYVPPPSASARLSDRFAGVVSEVVSGDCLVVRDAAGGAERRVNLSSVRAPRPAARDRAAEPWAAEAKEFLRQRLVGKEVAVRLEYTRKVPTGGPAGGGGEAGERVMSFATVTVEERSREAAAGGEGAGGTGTGAGAGEAKVNNVAELLLVRGLAQVVRHRGDEERSGERCGLCGCGVVG